MEGKEKLAEFYMHNLTLKKNEFLGSQFKIGRYAADRFSILDDS